MAIICQYIESADRHFLGSLDLSQLQYLKEMSTGGSLISRETMPLMEPKHLPVTAVIVQQEYSRYTLREVRYQHADDRAPFRPLLARRSCLPFS